jgi:hypothetical protein
VTTNGVLSELLKGEGVWGVVGITLDRVALKLFVLSTTNYTSTTVASKLGPLVLKPTTNFLCYGRARESTMSKRPSKCINIGEDIHEM